MYFLENIYPWSKKKVFHKRKEQIRIGSRSLNLNIQCWHFSSFHFMLKSSLLDILLSSNQKEFSNKFGAKILKFLCFWLAVQCSVWNFSAFDWLFSVQFKISLLLIGCSVFSFYNRHLICCSLDNSRSKIKLVFRLRKKKRKWSIDLEIHNSEVFSSGQFLGWWKKDEIFRWNTFTYSSIQV